MDVAASEFYNEKDKLYDLNFKEDVSMAPIKEIFLWNSITIFTRRHVVYWFQDLFRLSNIHRPSHRTSYHFHAKFVGAGLLIIMTVV